MATAVQLERNTDTTDLMRVVRAFITLTIIQTVLVFVVSIVNRSMDESINRPITAGLVFIGAMITICYPATVTRPRTIEGIAGAAGIGLGATWVFVLIDALLLQPIGVYTNRWRQVGGGSNWWHLPVWWMVGTYLAWMGGWIMANQANRTGESSVVKTVILVSITTAICAVLAIVFHFPGAGWFVPTFAVALLPGLALATIVSSFGTRRG